MLVYVLLSTMRGKNEKESYPRAETEMPWVQLQKDAETRNIYEQVRGVATVSLSQLRTDFQQVG